MRLGIGLHIEIDDIVLGAGRGRPEFAAVDHPFVAVFHGGRPHGADVGAGIGLRHRDRELDFAGEKFRQPVTLLLLRRHAHEVEPAKDAAGIGHHQIGGDARDLLGDDHHVEDAAAGAAVGFRERQRQEAGLGAGLEQLLGISALAVVLAHIFGRRVLLQELAHAVAQQPLFLGEAEIHDDPSQ